MQAFRRALADAYAKRVVKFDLFSLAGYAQLRIEAVANTFPAQLQLGHVVLLLVRSSAGCCTYGLSADCVEQL